MNIAEHRWIRAVVTPPEFPGDLNRTRLASTLHPIILIMMAGSVIYFVYSSLLRPELMGSVLVYVGPLLAWLVGLIFVVRKGKPGAAAWLLVGGLFLLLAVSAFTSDGARSPAYLVNVDVVLIVALLLGIRAAVRLGLLIAVFGAGLLILNAIGAVSYPQYLHPPTVYYASVLLVLFVAIALFRLSIRDMERSLIRAQQELELRRRSDRMLQRSRAAHAESELRYRQLFKDSADAVYIVARSGEILEFNPAAMNLFGVTEDEIGGLKTQQLYSDPDERSRLQTELEAAGSIFNYSVKLVKRDGTPMDCLVTATVRRDRQDEIIGYQGIVRDVTESRRQQRLMDEQVQRLKSLHRIDQAITGSTDAQITYKVLLTEIMNCLNFDAADLLLADPASGWLVFGAGRGFRTAALQHTRLRVGEGHAGRAALEQTAVEISVLAQEETSFRRSPELEEEGFVSYCGIPLVAKGRVCGVLEGFFRKPHHPTSDWWETARAFASQAAIAVDNATLFSDLQKTNVGLVQAYDATLEGWALAHDLRDHETVGHSKRVAEMTVRLAATLGVPEPDLIHMQRGALLHDIGKMAIPDAILLKQGPFNDDEREIMRQHPAHAVRLLRGISFLQPALEIPHYHHERWDGSGYPDGLVGEDIPIAARIFSVIDVWDALRSDRPYRRAWSRGKALSYIQLRKGEHFDPDVTEAFMALANEFEAYYK